MSACNLPKLKVCVNRRTTNRIPLRWETDELVWVPIASLSQTAPLEVVTQVAHGCPDEWPAVITGVRRPREVNASMPPKNRDFWRVKRLDAETVAFNRLDGSVLASYSGGGHLVFYKPFDYSPWSEALMIVRDRVGGNELATYSTDDNSLVFDPGNDSLWLEPGSEFAFNSGVFELKLRNPSGEKRAMCRADSEFIVTP